ncbi:hypothetical protein BDP27DRAFT_1429606 [Rhodocollybia butyracea]|uniref:F-box domain-containing protein n=1 Tax=Rhodocollybia butyracea TaxID=206335 RepID=A0A9P5U0S2_9AGAR|nr:hypothetical protein BDP27DRAFT_1429606 [Rhodocollybia butyracea]
MTPPFTQSGNPLRVNLSSEELSSLYNDLRFEFGPYVVTPERASGLRPILALADKDIKEHELEVARITKHLRIIQKETKRLKTQRAALLSLLSPMRRLPNETLLRIFEHACDINLLQCYPWMSSDNRPPTDLTSPAITYLPAMAISSVCNRWRTLALSLPGLWANLKVEIHTISGCEAEYPADFVDTVTRHLERSGDWPLRLDLDIQGDIPGNCEAGFPSLTQLTRHAWHWKMFKYLGDSPLNWYRILSELRFPLLEELDIVRNFSSDELDRFEHCPKLRAISASWLKDPTSRVLYNQLDHLDFTHLDFINELSATDFVDALHICSHLKSLEIGSITASPQNADLEQGGLGTWPNITSLTMATSASDPVFSSFNFPSLNNLVLYDVIGRRWQADTFVSFVSRSSCTITTFTLRGALFVSDLDLVAALRVMPTLSHFEVDFEVDEYRQPQNPFTSHFFSSLTHRAHESSSISLVPKLHSFRLRYESTDAFDDAAFVGMIQSRWFKPGSDLSAEMSAMGRSSIRSAVLKFTSREANTDIYKPLRILDAEGLRVVVTGTNGVWQV